MRLVAMGVSPARHSPSRRNTLWFSLSFGSFNAGSCNVLAEGEVTRHRDKKDFGLSVSMSFEVGTRASGCLLTFGELSIGSGNIVVGNNRAPHAVTPVLHAGARRVSFVFYVKAG